jgi:hypothetical protein
MSALNEANAAGKNNEMHKEAERELLFAGQEEVLGGLPYG